MKPIDTNSQASQSYSPVPTNDQKSPISLSSFDMKSMSAGDQYTKIDRFIDGIRQIFGDKHASLRIKIHDFLHATSDSQKAANFMELKSILNSDHSLEFRAEQTSPTTTVLSIVNTESSKLSTTVDRAFWADFTFNPFTSIAMPGTPGMRDQARLEYMLTHYEGTVLPLRQLDALQLAKFLDDLVRDIRQHPTSETFCAQAGRYPVALTAKEIKERLLFEVAACPSKHVAFHTNINESGAPKKYHSALNDLADLINDKDFTGVLREMQNEPNLLKLPLFQTEDKANGIAEFAGIFHRQFAVRG